MKLASMDLLLVCSQGSRLMKLAGFSSDPLLMKLAGMDLLLVCSQGSRLMKLAGCGL